MIEISIWFITLLLSLFWVTFFLRALKTVYAIPKFENFDIDTSKTLPKLSIIVAACNEADTIENALTTLLNQDYPNFEVIVVNDRSTDQTAQILTKCAKKFPHLKIVKIDDLPPRWLGKVYALKRGCQIASGEWILFTDADIHFKTNTLSTAVAYAKQNQLDHLTLFPNIKSNSFCLETVISAFRIMFLVSIKFHDIRNPKTEAAIGIGAFNLVKKSILKKSSAFAWLRMEVCDDVGLGLAIKKAGGKTGFAFACENVELNWYDNLKQMFKGVEKNLFAASAHYKMPRMIVLISFIFFFCFTPFIDLAAGLTVHPWLLALTAICLSVYLLSTLLITFRLKTNLLAALAIPLGMLVICAMIANSGIKCLKQGGIIWRGTLYPIDLLKKLRRVGF